MVKSLINISIVLVIKSNMLLSRYNLNMANEAGCDEVGRGCLAGPVVAAAVILPIDYFNTDIDDSKKLSKKKKDLLYADIVNNAISYSIQESSVQEIEEINILQASQLAMRRALTALTPKPEYILIDGNYWKDVLKIPYSAIVKGDGKYLSIAAASILAKVYRDNLMVKLAQEFPMYDWQNNAGYGTKKHKLGLEKHGKTVHHRAKFLH